MPFITLLATTKDVARSHSLLDALPHLAGMAMVMVSLTVLWGLCSMTAKLISTLTPKSPHTATLAPTSAPTNPPTHMLAPEIIAIIAAAVASVTAGKPVRIVSIKPMNHSWERAGRQSVLTSHRIR